MSTYDYKALRKYGERECDCQRCFYCSSLLANAHEHDHFPVPKAAGGTNTVPACINCHLMKDMTGIGSWPIEAITALMECWDDIPRDARLLVAKLFAVAYHRGDVQQ